MIPCRLAPRGASGLKLPEDYKPVRIYHVWLREELVD